MSNFWKEEFAKRPRAEGVDFVEWMFNPLQPGGKIYQTNSKEELCGGCVAYPRSQRYYWYMENGRKHYLSDTDVIVPAKVTLPRPIYRVSHKYWDNKEWFFENRADAEEFVIFSELEDMYETFCMHLIHSNSTPEEAMKAAWYAHWNMYFIEEKTLY